MMEWWSNGIMGKWESKRLRLRLRLRNSQPQPKPQPDYVSSSIPIFPISEARGLTMGHR
jgi:hypothetical protein